MGREFAKRIDTGAAGHVDEIWAIGRRASRLDALVRTLGITVRPFCLDLPGPACAVCPKFMKTEFLADPGDSETAQAMCAIGFESPENVVTAALKASAAGKDLCIPSPDMKAYYALSKLLPYQAQFKAQKMLGII